MSDEAQDENEGESEREPREGIFRKAAVDAAREPRSAFGDVLRISPLWLTASYWIIVGAFIAVLVLAVTARVDEYGRGPAVISASHRVAITTTSAGVVARVLVKPGDRIEAGAVMIQLNDQQEAADLARLDAEFEQQLVRSLLDRTDRASRDALVRLRAEKAAATAKVVERQVRAPSGGIVSDVRARPGQYVQAGAPLVSLLESGSRFRVIALLPGSSRAEVEVGMPLRLELAGYAYAYQTVSVTEVGSQVIGPAEARRFLGPELADTIHVEGPVTMVVAELDAVSFEVDGRTLEYHDGMSAMAEVPVRQVRLAVLLAPWLRRLF